MPQRRRLALRRLRRWEGPCRGVHAVHSLPCVGCRAHRVSRALAKRPVPIRARCCADTHMMPSGVEWRGACCRWVRSCGSRPTVLSGAHGAVGPHGAVRAHATSPPQRAPCSSHEARLHTTQSWPPPFLSRSSPTSSQATPLSADHKPTNAAETRRIQAAGGRLGGLHDACVLPRGHYPPPAPSCPPPASASRWAASFARVCHCAVAREFVCPRKIVLPPAFTRAAHDRFCGRLLAAQWHGHALC